jgi:hypothetical protein
MQDWGNRTHVEYLQLIWRNRIYQDENNRDSIHLFIINCASYVSVIIVIVSVKGKGEGSHLVLKSTQKYSKSPHLVRISWKSFQNHLIEPHFMKVHMSLIWKGRLCLFNANIVLFGSTTVKTICSAHPQPTKLFGSATGHFFHHPSSVIRPNF